MISMLPIPLKVWKCLRLIHLQDLAAAVPY